LSSSPTSKASVVDSAVKGGLLTALVSDSKGLRMTGAILGAMVAHNENQGRAKADAFSGIERLLNLIDQSTEGIFCTVHDFIDQYFVLLGMEYSKSQELSEGVEEILKDTRDIKTAALGILSHMKGTWNIGYQIMDFRRSHSTAFIKGLVASKFRSQSSEEAATWHKAYYEGGGMILLDRNIGDLEWFERSLVLPKESEEEALEDEGISPISEEPQNQRKPSIFSDPDEWKRLRKVFVIIGALLIFIVLFILFILYVAA
jgi:hypothetical protein